MRRSKLLLYSFIFFLLLVLNSINATSNSQFIFSINLTNYYDSYNATPSLDYNLTTNFNSLKVYTLPSKYRTKIIYFFYNLSKLTLLSDNAKYIVFGGSVKNKIIQEGRYGARIRTQIFLTSSNYKGKKCRWARTHYECHPQYENSTKLVGYQLVKDVGCRCLQIIARLCNGTLYNSTSLSGYVDNDSFHHYSIIIDLKKNQTFFLVDSELKLIAKISYIPTYLQLGVWGWDYTDITLHQFYNFSFLVLKTSPLLVLLSSVKLLSNNTLQIFLNAYYVNLTPLTYLAPSNFQVFLDNQELPIGDFHNFYNGSYELTTFFPPDFLGKRTLKIKISYKNQTIENSTQIFIFNSTPFKQKVLFISDPNWKNILSLVPLKKLTIISNRIDEPISFFINSYKPDQIIILGNVSGKLHKFETYRIPSYEDINILFFNSSKGIYAGEDRIKAARASLIASLLNKPIVFNVSKALPRYNFSQNSSEEIENFYLQELKKRNKNINYLILSDGNFSLDAIIASFKNGFIIEINSSNTTQIKNQILNTVNELNTKGFFINNSEFLTQGAYLLILGNIPFITKQDPVELSYGLNDELDGYQFFTDLEYGDLNNDTYLDIPVGRLPNDYEIASLMFARTFLPHKKRALVASEYLHTSWPVILLYGGGGMLHGKTISEILKNQGYEVTRLVEHRFEPVEFLTSLTPTSIKEFLSNAKTISQKISRLFGETIGAITYKMLIMIKILKFAEQGLEAYLEYDWSTFGPKLHNAFELLNHLEPNELLSLDAAIKLIYILWPYPFESLNKTTLIQNIPDSDLIYYEGLGNGSLWILPNVTSKNRYDGSEHFSSKDIPYFSSKMIWDNSDLAVRGSMYLQFLKRGSASFIGASAINYAPFSAEIDSRFFKQGETIGLALIEAINDFRDDWITWDPFSVIRPGIKSKSLREFILFGDPSLKKDPIFEKENYILNFSCDRVCRLEIEIPINFSVSIENNRTILNFDTNDLLLRAFKPIIPLKTFEFYLPENSKILLNLTKIETVKFNSTFFPSLQLLSHSNLTFSNISVSDEFYPEKEFRIFSRELIDKRKVVKLVVPLVRYNGITNESIVVKRIRFILVYETPLDFSIKTEDIELGEKERINIRVWSNFSKEKNITLILKIMFSNYTQTILKNLTVNEGVNSFETFFTPKYEGLYKIESFIVYEDPISVGPRISYFSVKKLKVKSYVKPKIEQPLIGVERFVPTNLTLPSIEENFSSICGDGICGYGENSSNCPSDCLVEAEPINYTKLEKRMPTGFLVLSKQAILIIFFTIFFSLVLVWLKKR